MGGSIGGGISPQLLGAEVAIRPHLGGDLASPVEEHSRVATVALPERRRAPQPHEVCLEAGGALLPEEELGLIEGFESPVPALGVDLVPREREIGVGVGRVDLDGSLVGAERPVRPAARILVEALEHQAHRRPARRVPIERRIGDVERLAGGRWRREPRRAAGRDGGPGGEQAEGPRPHKWRRSHSKKPRSTDASSSSRLSCPRPASPGGQLTSGSVPVRKYSVRRLGQPHIASAPVSGSTSAVSTPAGGRKAPRISPPESSVAKRRQIGSAPWLLGIPRLLGSSKPTQTTATNSGV